MLENNEILFGKKNVNGLYHSLLGYLYTDTNTTVAISHYSMAVALSKSRVEKQTLAKEIKRLHDKL